MLNSRIWIYLVGLVVLSALAFWVTRSAIIYQAPRSVMSMIETRIVQGAGGWNACYHNQIYGPRPQAARRANPDSIISSMAYDLSQGPVRVSGPVWPRYWSLSLYQQNSDNYFVINDRELASDNFDFVLSYGDQIVSESSSVPISSPTRKGILLVRRFAASEDDMPGIIANQTAMYCGPALN